ncbi:T9SS type A sorting domain-containing protein [Lacinutrix iliipiscaria]|uniref:T9SS type A sorting domain-containing protein n=1 Tax=Lacinutrix iliipiscaria TaxID=1230532 RepID=A0ABW5WLY7_9FLAO
MKKNYLIIILTLTTIFSYAQSYEFGIIHVSNYDFKIVAIPDFDSSGNTDASDVGFTLVLPAGADDVANQVGLLTGRPWDVQQYDAAFLTGLGLGDGSKDVFQFNLPPGQSILAHTSGQQIDLVSFQITNNPTSGEMYFLLNSDPIAMGAGGVLDSFYNSNIDATSTQDYFSSPAAGLDSFMFSTLTVEDITLDNASIQIYPNPTSELINISSSYQIQSTQLFDITGKRVLETKQTNQIRVNQLPVGVYLLKVYTSNGHLTKKIIIE